MNSYWLTYFHSGFANLKTLLIKRSSLWDAYCQISFGQMGTFWRVTVFFSLRMRANWNRRPIFDLGFPIRFPPTTTNRISALHDIYFYWHMCSVNVSSPENWMGRWNSILFLFCPIPEISLSLSLSLSLFACLPVCLWLFVPMCVKNLLIDRFNVHIISLDVILCFKVTELH